MIEPDESQTKNLHLFKDYNIDPYADMSNLRNAILAKKQHNDFYVTDNRLDVEVFTKWQLQGIWSIGLFFSFYFPAYTSEYNEL